MQPLTFVLAALAVYRLSRMISDEEGPGLPWGTEEDRKLGMFLRLRKRYPGVNWLGRGLECIMCLSVWVALPMAVYIDGAWTTPITWLALSAVTVLLREWKNRR